MRSKYSLFITVVPTVTVKIKCKPGSSIIPSSSGNVTLPKHINLKIINRAGWRTVIHSTNDLAISKPDFISIQNKKK